MFRNDFKKTNNQNSLLSAVKPQTKLDLDNEISTQPKQYTMTKSILKVYKSPETHKLYIDFAAAHALNLTSVRAIMLETPKYFEVTNEIIEKIKNNKHYEIEYITLPPRIKQDIMVYYKDNYLYIEPGAAYALGYISVSEFNNTDNLYGPLNANQIAYIKYNFNINYLPLSIDHGIKR